MVSRPASPGPKQDKTIPCGNRFNVRNWRGNPSNHDGLHGNARRDARSSLVPLDRGHVPTALPAIHLPSRGQWFRRSLAQIASRHPPTPRTNAIVGAFFLIRNRLRSKLPTECGRRDFDVGGRTRTKGGRFPSLDRSLRHCRRAFSVSAASVSRRTFRFSHSVKGYAVAFAGDGYREVAASP
jgi:hypothetical protein